MVALVLLLNTVIYTQNLATRGPQVEDGEAVAFRESAISDVGAVVDAENREEYEEWSKVRDNVTAAIARYDELHGRYVAERGVVADVEVDSLTATEGTLLHQTDGSRNFTNASGTADWMLVEDATDVRNFRLNVSKQDLSDDDSDAFRVRLADGATTWRIYVYEADDGDIAVSNDADGSAPESCTASGSEAAIDLTAGTVNGTDCPELDYPTGMAPYNVTFRNADEVTGTYSLTVGRPPTDPSVKTSNFSDPDAAESPRWAWAVYAVQFEIHFESPSLAFHTPVRAARGEPA
jgi:hypothetical protein